MDEARGPGLPLVAIGPGVRSGQPGEKVIAGVLASCAGIAVLSAIGTVLVLLTEAFGFFTQVSLLEFLTETRWTPSFQEKHFGILPLLNASVLVAAGAGMVALPGGLLAAVFLSEYAAPGLRAVLKPILDVLAGIPTVVYGYFALTFVTPVLQEVIPGLGPFNAASAALVLGVMALPTIASLSNDALRAVPSTQREAAYGLGATRVDVVTKVVIPAGMPGILAAFIVGLSRVFGETMVVAMAAGNSPNLTLNPMDSVQTLAAHILQSGQGNIAFGTVDYRALFAVGMVLFAATMALSLVARWIRGRVGEAG